jgi:integrase
MRNPNHPKKGSTTKVEPIRDLKHIEKIKDLLINNPRDLCLFTLGVNTNLRASDLVSITIGQVAHLKSGDQLCLKEKKTSKLRCISLNKKVIAVISDLIAYLSDSPETSPLFQSRKGKNKLTVGYVNNLVKSWCKETGLKGNFGSHTLRKTFGYVHRTQFCTDIPTLMIMFSHSSQKQTLDYLGIQPTEIKDAYMKEI